MGWYLVITEEMRAAGLSGNELLVYALILGFSQSQQGCFYGSISYVCEVCGISRATAIRSLQSLKEKGFIFKEENFQNGVKFVRYTASQIDTGSIKMKQGWSQNETGGSIKMRPNNKYDNTIDNNSKDKYKGEKFNFEKSLISLGVSEEVAAAWMQVRKTKRATNTKIAFDKIAAEIAKSGKTAEECIRTAVERSWQGFQAEWLEEKKPQQQKVKAPRYMSAYERNLITADRLFGTNLHEQKYGVKTEDIDI